MKKPTTEVVPEKHEAACRPTAPLPAESAAPKRPKNTRKIRRPYRPSDKAPAERLLAEERRLARLEGRDRDPIARPERQRAAEPEVPE